jgi:RNA polymerase sigma factor (sigma-70 family)
MDPSPNHDARRFPATAWTVIRSVQEHQDTARRAALERLIGVYWRPVYWQLRRDWNATHWEAADLTQEYFARLLKEDFLEGVSKDKGSFRSYVKATLRNFVLNAKRAEHATIRGGGKELIPIEDLDAVGAEPPGDLEGPEREFERELMRAIVREVLVELQDDCKRRDREVQYALFFQFYSGEQQGRAPSYKDLQDQFDLGPHDVKNHLAEMRVKFRKCVLDHLRDGISSEDELVREIREVFGE